MNPTDINYLAVLASALIAFLIGGLWYSPLLFGGAWMTVTGLDDAAIARSSAAKVFGGAFVLMLIASLNLAFFLGKEATLGFGVLAGLATGLGWVTTSLGVLYLFERRPLRHLLINGGYLVLTYALMGLILAGWKR